MNESDDGVFVFDNQFFYEQKEKEENEIYWIYHIDLTLILVKETMPKLIRLQ